MSAADINKFHQALIRNTTGPSLDTQMDARFYNIVNASAVFHNLRTGAILANIRGDRIEEMLHMLPAEIAKGVKYPIGTGNIIIVRKDQPDLVGLMDKLHESTTFHADTGKILGYFTPYDILSTNNSAAHSQAIEFTVTGALSGGKILTAHHFPQRVSSGLNVSARMADYKTRLLALPMPEGLSITDVKIMSAPAPNSKSRKRKNKRRNTTRRR